MNAHLELFRADGEWHIRYTDLHPDRQRTVDIMGSDTLFAGLPKKSTPAQALAEIQQLNPDTPVALT